MNIKKKKSVWEESKVREEEEKQQEKSVSVIY